MISDCFRPIVKSISKRPNAAPDSHAIPIQTNPEPRHTGPWLHTVPTVRTPTGSGCYPAISAFRGRPQCAGRNSVSRPAKGAREALRVIAIPSRR